MFAGHNDRLHREHQESAWAVYHVAALMRTKTMPSFSKFLPQRRGRKQTPDQMLAAIMTLNAMYGGAVIKKAKSENG